MPHVQSDSEAGYVDGTFDIRSAPGKGTRIEVVVPLKQKQELGVGN